MINIDEELFKATVKYFVLNVASSYLKKMVSPTVHVAYAVTRIISEVIDNMGKLYIGKETYGNIPIEEAFRKALEPYFSTNENEFEQSTEQKIDPEIVLKKTGS